MSTQPNKSTSPSEADATSGPGGAPQAAGGSAEPSLAESAAKPVSAPGKDEAAPDATRPEGIAPVSDPAPGSRPGPAPGKDSAWSPSGGPGRPAIQPAQPAQPVGPGAPGAPGAQGAPGAPGAAPAAAGGKDKRAVARLGGGTKSPRRAQLQLSRLEPWSVMKFSFVMSLVAFIVLLVAVTVLYVILSGLGVFDAISETVNDLTRDQNEATEGVDAGGWFGFGRIFGYTVLVGALNVLLITALSTVGSVIYNLAADLVGGVEVTLKEAE
ncbi:DUF3566 domain-containing protein [Thermomonospora amylolytica]|uniref:DUF3566 domain-containing protein n=1 Tax=Thermomonospora amylolytica TaxID=1411117 RepID=UPI001F236BAF|nr:DUF3566 domain-containing protein [Thermomonospora amylolytica]